MIKTVVCSECGYKFPVEVDGETTNPSSCVICEKQIKNIITSPGSNDFLAVVE
jgi:predicted Zn-ribbon and HTH transcriptional regulator